MSLSPKDVFYTSSRRLSKNLKYKNCFICYPLYVPWVSIRLAIDKIKKDSENPYGITSIKNKQQNGILRTF